jgi:hypothetical protein
MRVDGKYGTFGLGGGVPLMGEGTMEVREDGIVLSGFTAVRSAGSMLIGGLVMGAATGAGAWAVQTFLFAGGGPVTFVGPAIGGAIAGALLAYRADTSKPRTETIPWGNVKTIKRGAGKGPITITTHGLHPRGKDRVTFFAAADKEKLVAALNARRPI